MNIKSFLRLPISYKGLLKVYPPSLNEVVLEEEFSNYLNILTFSQEDIEDSITNYGEKEAEYIPKPLEFIVKNSYINKDFEETFKKAFNFFLHEEVSFLYDHNLLVLGDLNNKLLEIKDISELIMIDEDFFFDLQNLIRVSVGIDMVEKPNPNEHPKIKRMKAKARYRDKIKKKQNKGLKLEDTIASICCMGIGITPLNIGEMSYAAVSAIMNRYQEKEKFKTDVDSILAGADAKKINPKYWIRNLDND